MEDKLVTLINRYKSGETNAFIDIQNKMNPLITKYSIILCFRDFEDFQDMYSEWLRSKSREPIQRSKLMADA